MLRDVFVWIARWGAVGFAAYAMTLAGGMS